MVFTSYFEEDLEVCAKHNFYTSKPRVIVIDDRDRVANGHCKRKRWTKAEDNILIDGKKKETVC